MVVVSGPLVIQRVFYREVCKLCLWFSQAGSLSGRYRAVEMLFYLIIYLRINLFFYELASSQQGLMQALWCRPARQQ